MKIPGTYKLPDGTEIRGAYLGEERRFVASASGWKKLTNWAKTNIRLCERQSFVPHSGVELHHRFGRGGGKRDDRLVVDGEKNLFWLCRFHHDSEVIERRRPVNNNSLQSTQL